MKWDLKKSMSGVPCAYNIDILYTHMYTYRFSERQRVKVGVNTPLGSTKAAVTLIKLGHAVGVRCVGHFLICGLFDIFHF